MERKVINCQTGEVTFESLSAEELAERAAWERDVLPNEQRKVAEEGRINAYRAEADPLFFKAQRGEATTDEWTAKVAEIKARFPYPGGEE